MVRLEHELQQAIDVPATIVKKHHLEADTQTTPIERRDAAAATLENTTRTTQTDAHFGAPPTRPAASTRLDVDVVDRLLVELARVDEENELFAPLDSFHIIRSLRLVVGRSMSIESVSVDISIHLPPSSNFQSDPSTPICGVRCGDGGGERRVAVMCGERIHTTWCLHTSAAVLMVVGSRRHWTRLGSCPSEATFAFDGSLVVGSASGELTIVTSEGDTRWSTSQLHAQSITALQWLGPRLLLSTALDGRIVISTLTVAGGLEPLRSTTISVGDLPRLMRRSNDSALKVGVVAAIVSSIEVCVATDTGALLRLDIETLESRALGVEMAGIEQLAATLRDDRFFIVTAAKDAKLVERHGAPIEWLGVEGVIEMRVGRRGPSAGLCALLTADELVIVECSSTATSRPRTLLRTSTSLVSIDFDERGNLVGVDSRSTLSSYRLSDA